MQRLATGVLPFTHDEPSTTRGLYLFGSAMLLCFFLPQRWKEVPRIFVSTGKGTVSSVGRERPARLFRRPSLFLPQRVSIMYWKIRKLSFFPIFFGNFSSLSSFEQNMRHFR